MFDLSLVKNTFKPQFRSTYYNIKYAKKKLPCSNFRSIYPYKEILSILLLNKPKELVLFAKQPFWAHEKLIKPLFIIIYSCKTMFNQR